MTLPFPLLPVSLLMIPTPFKPPALQDTTASVVECILASHDNEVYVDGEVCFLTKDELNIRTHNTARMLKIILQDKTEQYDISRYFWERHLHVDPLTRPRSHPKFILDAEYSATPEEEIHHPEIWKRQLDMLRSVLVHEQLHLFVGPLNRRINPRLTSLVWKLKMISPLREIPIPKILIERVGEQRARAATDLHIVVNWLELQANKRFMGTLSQAQDLITSVAVYQDIYQAVIEADVAIAEIFRQPEYRDYLLEHP